MDRIRRILGIGQVRKRDDDTSSKETLALELKDEWWQKKRKKETREKILEQNVLKRGLPESGRSKIMIKILLGDLSWRLIGKRVIKNENEVDQETVRQIKADGTRTLANDYEGVEMDRLVELLMKYANHNTNVKYCQGMSDIAANVLKVFGVENDQTCFEVFSRLIELEMSSGDVGETGSIFDTRLSQMKSVMVKQKILIRKLDGNLYRILYTNETNPVGFVAFKWMLTYFTRFNGLRDRIWEYLIFYGFDILYYFTVAILKYHEEEIKQADEESLLLFLGDIESKYIEPNTVVNIVEEYMRHV